MIPLAKPDLTGNESKYIADVLASGRLAMGPYCEKFEAMFCEFLGTKNAIACSSGTLGLQICLEALFSLGYVMETCPQVGMSHETFGASMNAVMNASPDARLSPTLYDARYNIYVPCHIFGLPAPDFMEADIFFDYMIEDACEALGAKLGGRHLGTFGKAGVFGFYPNKVLTTGEGGMIVTDDDDFAKCCRMIVNQGRDGRGPHEILGTNARMSELQAAVGVAQMERIDEILEKRRRVADRYLAMLDIDGLLAWDIEAPEDRESWFAFPLTSDNKDALLGLQDYLNLDDIPSSLYFPRMEWGEYDKWKWERRLVLPLFTQMTQGEVETVVRSVNEWANR